MGGPAGPTHHGPAIAPHPPLATASITHAAGGPSRWTALHPDPHPALIISGGHGALGGSRGVDSPTAAAGVAESVEVPGMVFEPEWAGPGVTLARIELETVPTAPPALAIGVRYRRLGRRGARAPARARVR